MKRTFSTELAYVFGIVFVARGVVLMEKADFGVSMVVAPAYLLYRWLSPVWSFVTFGMAEYCLQAVLLLAMCLLLRFRVSYLFSFVTAVVYGFALDAFMLLGAALPAGSVWLKILLSLANGQNEADCVVLPSYHEGMSNVLLEGAATGRALITSDIPGCREAVEDGVSGYLCPAQDAEGLTQAMRDFAQQSFDRQVQMGQSGRALVERKFDKQLVVAKTLDGLGLPAAVRS